MEEQESGKSNRMYRKSLIALWLMPAVLLASASAQETKGSKSEQAPTPLTPKVINLWPGVAPGSEQWKQPETTLGSGASRSIVNVTTSNAYGLSAASLHRNRHGGHHRAGRRLRGADD